MYGAVLGDIIGSVYEFSNIKTKDFKLFSKYSCPTDDTVMTIAIANALIESNKDKKKLKEIVVDNMVSIGRKYESCGYGGNFYGWIMTDNHEPYNSYGNGAAMRVSACGYVASSLKEAKELSKIVTEVSHNHEEGLKAAEAVSVAIYMAYHNKTMDEIKKYIIDNYYNIDFKLDEIRDTYTFHVSCQKSVPQAFEAFFESISYEDAIRNAISIGGDSDTIAAITGAVAEAYYGIPNEILNEGIKYLDELQKDILEKFYKKFSKEDNKILTKNM